MADFYRVKNGNWNLAESWATATGGTTYHANPPTSADNIYFDANTPTGTHTVNIEASGLDVNFTNFTGTFTGTSTFNVYGNWTLGAGMTFSFTGILSMRATSGTKTVTSNGITMYRLHLNGSGGTFSLADTLRLNLSTSSAGTAANFYLQAGTFSHNNQEIILGGDNSSIDANTTFYKITRTGTAVTTGLFIFFTNFTVSNEFKINGNSAINRLLVRSDILGTQRTITAATVTVTNADFRDIKGAGAGSWNLSAITGGSGDCGGNTDITFTTADDWYWHADTGNFSNYAKWYTATNGGGTQMASTRVPLPQDTCYFDANSFDSGSQTVTQDMVRMGGVNFTGATNTPTFTVGTSKEFYGSIKLISGMTFSNTGGTNYFYNRGNITIECGGKSFGNHLQIYAIGGEVKLSDKFFMTGGQILTLNNGTFDANNQDLYISQFASSNSNTRNLKMGSGTWELYGKSSNFTVFNLYTSTNLTFDAGTSTIKLSVSLSGFCYFYGGGKTFNNIWINTSNDSSSYYTIIRDSNTFNDLKIDAGRVVNFETGKTQTVTTFTAEGTAVSLITLRSSTTTNATLAKAGGGTISCDYMDVDYMTGNPDTTWYMGTHSTDGGHNSQIYFTDPPSTATGNFFQLF